jgi:transcriptional regulator NrdR family protein
VIARKKAPEVREKGLKCPDCGFREWKVYDTTPEENEIRRIRVCKRCGRDLITYERPAGSPADA